MNIKEVIKGIVESQLAEDEFLVDIILKGAIGTQKLIVFVDSDSGMTIDGCSKISKYISGYLEEEDFIEASYILEVSSPGLDHPLKLRRQYLKNVGRELNIRTIDSREYKGTLLGLAENKVIVELRTKSKENNGMKQIEIPFDDIDRAMVLVSFSKQG